MGCLRKMGKIGNLGKMDKLGESLPIQAGHVFFAIVSQKEIL